MHRHIITGHTIRFVKRRLYNTLAAVSLVLCLGALLAWARSFSLPYYLDYIGVDDSAHTESQCGVWLKNGRLSIAYGRTHWPTPMTPLVKAEGWQFHRNPWWPEMIASNIRHEYPEDWRLGSFKWRRFPGPGGLWKSWAWRAGVNLLIPVAIFAVVPIMWRLQFARTQFRRRRGLCLACGYDIRMTSERCPECGTPTSPQ